MTNGWALVGCNSPVLGLAACGPHESGGRDTVQPPTRCLLIWPRARGNNHEFLLRYKCSVYKVRRTARHFDIM